MLSEDKTLLLSDGSKKALIDAKDKVICALFEFYKSNNVENYEGKAVKVCWAYLTARFSREVGKRSPHTIGYLLRGNSAARKFPNNAAILIDDLR